MSDKKKATCLVPSAIVGACRNCFATTHLRSPAAGHAQLISEGIALVARRNEGAPKLIDQCRSKYPRFDQEISTHIPASVREQARLLKRPKGFGSFQELYLEVILASLVARSFLTAGLEAAAGDGGLPREPGEGRRRAA
jgi:hypothetical protein